MKKKKNRINDEISSNEDCIDAETPIEAVVEGAYWRTLVDEQTITKAAFKANQKNRNSDHSRTVLLNGANGNCIGNVDLHIKKRRIFYLNRKSASQKYRITKKFDQNPQTEESTVKGKKRIIQIWRKRKHKLNVMEGENTTPLSGNSKELELLNEFHEDDSSKINESRQDDNGKRDEYSPDGNSKIVEICRDDDVGSPQESSYSLFVSVRDEILNIVDDEDLYSYRDLNILPTVPRSRG